MTLILYVVCMQNMHSHELVHELLYASFVQMLHPCMAMYGYIAHDIHITGWPVA